MAEPMDVHLDNEGIIVNRGLAISLHRTIRVPDNQHISELPPDLGQFPLREVSHKSIKNMPSEMVAKGGLFMPMYRESTLAPATPR